MSDRRSARVLVTHPGRQHSHRAALALAGGGMLAGYWAGVPCLQSHGRLVPRPLWRRVIRYSPVPLPAGLVRWHPQTPTLRRLGDALLPPSPAAWVDFAACRGFDRWAARGVRRVPHLDAVIACEISALRTFDTARRLGVMTILDAPSIHHAVQDRLHGYAEPAGLHRRIVAVKEAEISRADHILVCSNLARRTYLDAGVPSGRVHVVTLGADLALFTPVPEAAPRDSTEFVFVFAGAASRRKGFDLLLQAFRAVRQADAAVGLEVIGPPGEASSALGDGSSDGIRVLGSLSQEALAQRLRIADCLVLPSREDSFGLVVPEALACGVPVIVSDMVGAQDLVTHEVTGWTVPAGDVGALAGRMVWCARNRETLRAMRPACRQAAEAATWEAHHARLVNLLEELLAARRA